MSLAGPGPAAAPPVLALRGITKRFGTLVANDSISLDLARGEVLALLGENGAGKSTLVSILFGHYEADAGTIEVDGARLPPGQPRAALAAGIGMVHQHFSLADNLSVLDNLMLGNEPLWQPFSRRRAALARLETTARRFGLGVDPLVRVGSLSVGERQRVEILKALVSGRGRGDGGDGARVLILDEPTAVLTPAEAESLFATLRQLVAQGLGVIFISHKLDEVLRVSDQVAVLRAGRLVATLPTAQADKATLATLMVGHEIALPRRTPGARGTLVCAVRVPAVELDLHAGEIVAVAGVAGNGQQALVDLLCGLRAPAGGTVTLAGRAMPANPRAWIDAGVARIPEDRHAVGVIGDLPVWENAVLDRHASLAFARWGVCRRGAAQAHARAIVRRFDVRGLDAAGVATPTRALSGGNMQKLILGRVLMPTPRPRSTGDHPPRGSGPALGGPAHGPEAVDLETSEPPLLIVADQPTWGLDVGAVAYVHQQLLDACAQGAALLLVSEDLDEIFALADRIAVMQRGRLGAARPTAQWTLAQIGLAMAGGTSALHAA
ncbi:MAG: ABC transporter ATP-binding protein [Burkholderiaceae bacterium]